MSESTICNVGVMQTFIEILFLFNRSMYVCRPLEIMYGCGRLWTNNLAATFIGIVLED